MPAGPLRRRPRRHDRDPHRQPARRRSVGMVVRLLSRLASGEHQSGTAATFDQARADFEAAWRVFLSNRTEADFQAWRDERDWTARKYALWEAGNRLPANEWEPGKPCKIYLKCPMRRDFQQSAARGNRHSRPPHHRCRNVALSRFAFLPPSPI